MKVESDLSLRPFIYADCLTISEMKKIKDRKIPAVVEIRKIADFLFQDPQAVAV